MAWSFLLLVFCSSFPPANPTTAPPVCFLSLWICLFWTLHVNLTKEHIIFVASFPHSAQCLSDSPLWQYQRFVNRSHCLIRHILLIPSPITEALDFQFELTMDNTAVNIWTHFFISLGYIPSSRTAGPHGKLCVIFEEITRLWCSARRRGRGLQFPQRLSTRSFW